MQKTPITAHGTTDAQRFKNRNERINVKHYVDKYPKTATPQQFKQHTKTHIQIIYMQEPFRSFHTHTHNNLLKNVQDERYTTHYESQTSRSIILTKNDTGIQKIKPIASGHNDITIIQIDKLITISIYQQPNGNETITTLHKLLNKWIHTHPIVICGEWNARHHNWDRKKDERGTAAHELINSLGL